MQSRDGRRLRATFFTRMRRADDIGPPRLADHVDNAEIEPIGSASQARIDRPSNGTRREASPRVPRSAPGSSARRDDDPVRRPSSGPSLALRRSALRGVASGRRSPTSSLTSAISVFSSMISSARRPGCQATMSMTPRSLKIAKDTSGANSHSGKASRNQVATASWSAECRALSNRSRSPARQRARRSTRTSSAEATRRKVTNESVSRWPRSMRETVASETPARSARSRWRQPRLCRTTLIAEPNRLSFMRGVWRPRLTRRLPGPAAHPEPRAGQIDIPRRLWPMKAANRAAIARNHRRNRLPVTISPEFGRRPAISVPRCRSCRGWPWPLGAGCRAARARRPRKTEHPFGVRCVDTPLRTAQTPVDIPRSTRGKAAPRCGRTARERG